MIMLDAQSKDMMNYTHKAHAHTTVYNVPSYFFICSLLKRANWKPVDIQSEVNYVEALQNYCEVDGKPYDWGI